MIMRANVPESEIARLLGVRIHIVRRALGMFLERRVFLQRSAFVNPFALGLLPSATRLSLPLASQKHYEKFRDILAHSEETVAVVEHGGAYQIELRTYTRDMAHLHRFYESLAQRFPYPFHIHSCSTILEQEYSGVVDPNVTLPTCPLMGYGPIPPGAEPLSLDERDHLILSALCNLKYLKWSQVARELSMPLSTLIHRVTSLEKAGVIQGHYYVVDVKVFHDLPILIHVSSKVMTGTERLALKKFCQVHPKVAWMSIFFGAESAEMLARVQNLDEARGVMADISQCFSGIIDSVHMTAPLKFFKWSDYPYTRYATLAGR